MTRLAVESARITRIDSADGPALIELHGSDASIGIGETRASPVAFHAAARLCASLIGMDALQTTGIRERLTAAARGLGIPTAVVGSVECAVWDLLGRHLQAPLHVLFGTSRRQSVVAPGIVRMNDEGESVDAIVARAAALVREQGHDTLLVVISKRQAARDALVLRELRRVFGSGMRIRVECSSEGNAGGAQPLLDAIEDLDIEYLANAASTLIGLEHVRRTCATPLASSLLPGDGLAAWVRASAGEVIIGDAAGWGGIAAFRKHAAVCRAFTVDLAVCATDTLGPAIGTSLQLIASHSAASKGFHGVAGSFGGSSVIAPEPVVRDGRLAVPEGPGIGWSLDTARLHARVHEQAVITSPAGVQS